MNDYNNNGGGSFQERPMVKGEWPCSNCGTTITELPFKPAEGRPIYCRDCYRNMKPKRDFR